MSEHASATIGLLPAVEASLLLRHSPVAAFLRTYLPDAAVEAVNAHCCVVALPQADCVAWTPAAVPSRHLPPPLTTWKLPPWAVVFHCWLVVVATQATWTSRSAAPLTHLPLEPEASV